MDERKKNDRSTLKQTLTIWSLALIWCWISGIVVRTLFWCGDLGAMISVPNTLWDAADLAWKLLVLSAIFTLFLAAFVWLKKPKRLAMTVLLGGVIPHLLLNWLAAAIIGGFHHNAP